MVHELCELHKYIELLVVNRPTRAGSSSRDES